MKLIKKLFTVLAASALLTGSFMSCSNLSVKEDYDNEFPIPYGRVAFDCSAELTYIKLRGTKDGTTTTFGQWATVAELKDASIDVPVGEWLFKLSATYDGDTFKGETTGTIEKGRTTALTFNLVRVGAAAVEETIDVGFKWYFADYAGDYTYTNNKYTVDSGNSVALGNNVVVTGQTTLSDSAATTDDETKNKGYVQLGNQGDNTKKNIKVRLSEGTKKIIVWAKCGTGDTEANASKTSAILKVSGITAEPVEFAKGGSWVATTYDVDLKADTDVYFYNGGESSAGSLNIAAIIVTGEKTVITGGDDDDDDGTQGSGSGTQGGGSSTIGGDPSDNETSQKTEVTVTGATENVQILDSDGVLESAWVKFAPVTGATSYEVYANDVKIDNELIRGYSTTAGGTSVQYYRADAVGLKAGTYTLRVVAKTSSGNKEASTNSLTVMPHERIGFAFHEGYVPGAYKMDGTLKDDAVVVYVDNSNFNSVKVTTKNAKGADVTFTGLQELLDTSGWWKTSSKPLVIRVLGKIDATTGFPSSSWGSKDEGLQVKCNKKNQDMNFTIEGIGDDAVFHGFGVLCRQTKGVELRNFAEMAFADDGISLDTDNYNTWVHNLDVFYGATGGDSDQAKGDGSLDVKGDSKYQTYSYIHFWDSGKMSLCGMKSESGPNYITYHHNWFDHSDSRHPRVRTMTVHVFNNYYDGNAKYGAGATTGADLFVENNYFRNVKFPMMSSLQGNDVYAGSSKYNPGEYGTFSGENSGSIKSYGNKIIDTNKNTSYWTYGAKTILAKGNMVSASSLGIDTTKHFDAYEVTNRSDTVPESVKGFVGGDTYSNFDVDSKFYIATLTPDTPDVAKDKVTKYSGRVNGGDFRWTFTESDDTNDKVVTELKSSVVGYKSKLVSTNIAN